jgi:hypothetical protein
LSERTRVPAEEMSEKTGQRDEFPKAGAGLLSSLTFWWTLPLYRRVQEKETLELEDLFAPLPEDEACRLGDQLERYKYKQFFFLNSLTKYHMQNILLAKFWKHICDAYFF